MLPDEAFRPWRPAPAPFPEASRPDPAAVLDYDALRASASADEQLMREMMTLFIVGCPRLMERIGDAIAAGDAIKLHAAADALRGSATTIAAVRVADAARVLERLRGQRDLRAPPGGGQIHRAACAVALPGDGGVGRRLSQAGVAR